MPAEPHALLNHPQREHLAVLLAQMEDALDKLAAAAEPPCGPRHHLTMIDDDLPAELATQVQPVIQSLRGQIARLAAEFRLRPRRMSRARFAVATVTAELVRIEDSYAGSLRGYGDVTPDLANVLDPALRQLHDGWARMYRALTDIDP
jgi:hypothetical protein